jgi:hypothetical protein
VGFELPTAAAGGAGVRQPGESSSRVGRRARKRVSVPSVSEGQAGAAREQTRRAHSILSKTEKILSQH